ncbi:MAG: VWA domain-containing protein [Candidatus Omnitrophica bacterium]|nr:VWA domain-containing protein [Candidatus Omnitrophota bacterium]
MIEFRHPAFFFLIFLLPLIFYFSFRRKKSTLIYSTAAFLEHQSLSWRMMGYRFMPIAHALVFLLFIIALARPQRVTAERDVQSFGVDIILALDISGSMLAEDFKPENRMQVAKQEAAKFIQGRQNDRIGLVVFARKAFTQCPLTMDYDVLLRLLKEIKIGMISDGTAVGMGLATAVNRLRDSHAKSKVIILLTDGDSNAGNIDPITAAELAKTFGLKVYTICVGRGGLVPFPVNDPLFGKRYVQASIEVDETVLKRIADITGGLFFRARDPKGLSEIYEKINRLEKTEIKVKVFRTYDELFSLFLIPALCLLLLESLLNHTIFSKVP